MAKKITQTTKPVVVPKFKKEALLKAKKYAGQRDLLAALLKDDQEYTAAEVNAILENFKKGKVK